MSDSADREIEDFLHAHGPFEKPPTLSCGERVGDWKTLAFLGHGGSAEVFRAENVVTGIVGALKVLYRTDDAARARFRREARLIAETKSTAFPKPFSCSSVACIVRMTTSRPLTNCNSVQ